MPIKFTRQPDGTYAESGDFTIGTRTVGVWIDGVRAIGSLEHNAKDRLSKMREHMKTPHILRAQEYELREIRVDAPEVIEKRTAALVKARKKKADWEKALEEQPVE